MEPVYNVRCYFVGLLIFDPTVSPRHVPVREGGR